MSVVTIAEAWPAAGRPFTVAELDRMPDDGRRYELLDGVLIVSPRPTTIHQFVAMRLLRVLADACPEDLCVVPEPAVEWARRPSLILISRWSAWTRSAAPSSPTRRCSWSRSGRPAPPDRPEQEESRVRAVRRPLVLDREPGPAAAGATVFELRDGRYALVATTPGPFVAHHPFAVSIDPACLTAGLRR